jgi:hypothetical protein
MAISPTQCTKEILMTDVRLMSKECRLALALAKREKSCHLVSPSVFALFGAFARSLRVVISRKV